MIKSTSRFFGNKQKFAFEIENGIIPMKGNLKIWINNTCIGNFKKQDKYIHVIEDCRRFYKNYTSFYELQFDKMSSEEIFNYVIAENLIWSKDLKDLEEAERRQKYIRFFGLQFDDI